MQGRVWLVLSEDGEYQKNLFRGQQAIEVAVFPELNLNLKQILASDFGRCWGSLTVDRHEPQRFDRSLP